jgi:hypothetical protein
MEVCALFKKLLLLATMSKCQLAHRAQARMLQAREILVERGDLHHVYIFACSKTIAGEPYLPAVII